jgi:hypothetical protein
LTAHVGIVVPTLGQRPEYLLACLKSIRSSGVCSINLVAPKSFDYKSLMADGLIDQFTLDTGGGLARAINSGLRAFSDAISRVGWLGDDDLLALGSLEFAIGSFQVGDVAVYGDCNFIDEAGRVFWTLRSSSRAVRVLHWAPNKVPQPGSLLLRDAVEKVGYLDESLGWAFDQDLFLKLRKLGRIRYVPQTLASFRWHDESLSSGQSANSIREAAKVRIAHTPRILRWFASARETLHVQLALSIPSKLDRQKKND